MRSVRNRFIAVGLTLILLLSGMQAGAAVTDPAVSEREISNAALAREAAVQGMVLLENAQEVLPLEKGSSVALFGMGAYLTMKGGTGSGDVHERESINIWDGLTEAGFALTSYDYLAACREYCRREKAEYTGNLWDTQIIGETLITQAQAQSARGRSDTAIYVISRNAGEGTDRAATAGDYYLSEEEQANLKLLDSQFERLVIVLNVPGVMDTGFFAGLKSDAALLLMSQAGMEGGLALADVLCGDTVPSGKLTDTWAASYTDYPSSESFGSNDGQVDEEYYEEGIYVGYRYFDSFNVTPAYAFGYGLSYTDFSIETGTVMLEDGSLRVPVTVTNTGSTYSGRQVVQLYVSAPAGELEKPYQELSAYVKTEELAPGESQESVLEVSLESYASYSEDLAAYVLEPGDYIVRIGSSSRDTHVAAVLTLDEMVITQQLSNHMGSAQISELSTAGTDPYSYADEAGEIQQAQHLEISAEDLKKAILSEETVESQSETVLEIQSDDSVGSETVPVYVSDTTEQAYLNANLGYNLTYKSDGRTYAEQIVTLDGDFSEATLIDVQNGDITMEEFVSGLTVSQMADIVIGGSKLPDANGQSAGASSDNLASASPSAIVQAERNSVQGAAGETVGIYIESKKIPNIILADGPAGLRLTSAYEDQDGRTYYQYMTAWPISTLLAQTWDTVLIERVGEAIAEEMRETGVSVILSPALNIHRNPLCGRNFEYYSEDPLISGLCAAAYVNGVQKEGDLGACIKHFACNNQEANRTMQSSEVSERALREIYLKGFEIAVRLSSPMTVMTSYNRINGTATADDRALLTDILRDEWGFDGFVMTDWGGGQSTPSISLQAGNDLIMPGSDTDDITVRAFSDEEPAFSPGRVYPDCSISQDLYAAAVRVSWGEFVPDAGGNVVLFRTVDQSTFDEQTVPVVQDGAISYIPVSDAIAALGDAASVSENSDGTVTVCYQGYYLDNNISLGDLQRSVMRILTQVMKTQQFRSLITDTP